MSTTSPPARFTSPELLVPRPRSSWRQGYTSEAISRSSISLEQEVIAYGELPPALERPEDGFQSSQELGELVQIPDPLRPTETRLIGHGDADDGSLARRHGERG